MCGASFDVFVTPDTHHCWQVDVVKVVTSAAKVRIVLGSSLSFSPYTSRPCSFLFYFLSSWFYPFACVQYTDAIALIHVAESAALRSQPATIVLAMGQEGQGRVGLSMCVCVPVCVCTCVCTCVCACV